MALKTTKNNRKAFDFSKKDNAQLAEMLKLAIQMVREAQEMGGRREGYRLALVDEVSAECERRGMNCAAIACSA